MRRRPFTGPLILVLLGLLFLWNNLHPETPVFDLISQYWPFILIGWGLLRLIEVLIWRETPYRGSFTGGEIALVVLICIAGSGIWAAHRHGIRFTPGGLQMFGNDFDFPVAAQAPAGGVKRIVFDNLRGNLRVTGADVANVTVNGHKLVRAYNRGEAESTDHKTPVEIVTQGDRLLIRTNQDHAPGSQRISDDLEVTVPRAMAIEARGRYGDFQISDVSGDVDLTSDRADVRLARLDGNARIQVGRSDLIRAVAVKGAVDIDGRGSDIDLQNISGQVTINGAFMGTLAFQNLAKPLQFEGARNTEMHVAAVPGHISMDLGEFNGRNLTGPVRLVMRSRDVRIQNFTQSLELESDRGDIELTPAHIPLPSIEVRSAAGSIELMLPEKSEFQLQATAERGDALNEFGPGIQKDVDGRSATLKGKVGDGPMVHLSTERGSISIRKAGAADRPLVPAAPLPPHSPGVPDLKDSETEL
ncbi:MAG TPA: DUF4097 family beta strand repeat-containing protein [Bryobacteraceae bacterium]|nr:DUF4097 family beta strand repeat-containing protein [Bryobacteraceae bacterium]